MAQTWGPGRHTQRCPCRLPAWPGLFGLTSWGQCRERGADSWAWASRGDGGTWCVHGRVPWLDPERGSLAGASVCVGAAAASAPPSESVPPFSKEPGLLSRGGCGHFSIWEGGAGLPTAQSLLLLHLLDGPSALPCSPLPGEALRGPLPPPGEGALTSHQANCFLVYKAQGSQRRG